MTVQPNSKPPLRSETLSQTGQDFWVIGEVFNEMRNGFFVEVGAADGVTLSNTCLLERDYGWMGICIEADPCYFASLKEARSAICVNACVDGTAHEVEFAQRKLLGGIHADGLDNEPGRTSGESYSTVRMMTRPLVEILREQLAPPLIDYLSIDVEGAEERILGSFPFESYRFHCMTVERPKPALRKVLADNGYVVIKEIPGYDVFYVHRSFMNTYVANVFAFWASPRQQAEGDPAQRPTALRRPWHWSKRVA
jgi:FkbM family methyltransferase